MFWIKADFEAKYILRKCKYSMLLLLVGSIRSMPNVVNDSGSRHDTRAR